MITADNKTILPKDIKLYAGGRYIGYYQFSMFRRIFSDYHKNAVESARLIDWDEIILFAVIRFAEDSKAPVSADFMIKRMTEEILTDTYKELENGCRCFFVRHKKEDINDK